MRRHYVQAGGTETYLVVGRAMLWLLGERQAGGRDTCDWSYRLVDYSEWLQCLFVWLRGSGRASALRALLDPR